MDHYGDHCQDNHHESAISARDSKECSYSVIIKRFLLTWLSQHHIWIVWFALQNIKQKLLRSRKQSRLQGNRWLQCAWKTNTRHIEWSQGWHKWKQFSHNCDYVMVIRTCGKNVVKIHAHVHKHTWLYLRGSALKSPVSTTCLAISGKYSRISLAELCIPLCIATTGQNAKLTPNLIVVTCCVCTIKSKST